MTAQRTVAPQLEKTEASKNAKSRHYRDPVSFGHEDRENSSHVQKNGGCHRARGTRWAKRKQEPGDGKRGHHAKIWPGEKNSMPQEIRDDAEVVIFKYVPEVRDLSGHEFKPPDRMIGYVSTGFAGPITRYFRSLQRSSSSSFGLGDGIA